MVAPAATYAPRLPGLVLAPFRALRYDTSRLGDLARLTSPPYDVIGDQDRDRLEQRDPHNVVRLILPRDRQGAPGSRYRRAAGRLAAWREDAVLRADPTPALYVYEERIDGHVQRGLVGALGLAQPADGIILPHENTMAGPVADRLALTEATAANLEPIFLVYEGGGAASRAVAAADARDPLVITRTDDGVAHRLWALTDPTLLSAVADDLRPRRAVIADGHHRYATYLQHQADRHAAGAGQGAWDRGLAYLVDTTAFGPRVEPIHRTVPSLPLETALARAATAFVVTSLDAAAPLAALAEAGRRGPAFLLAGAGRWALLTDPTQHALDAALPAHRSSAWRALDVSIAHALLIDRLWRLADTEDVVGFAHTVGEAVAAAAAGTALLLNPTPVEAVAEVARAGERMPRKSTLFTPKPRTGLLLRPFDLEDSPVVPGAVGARG